MKLTEAYTVYNNGIQTVEPQLAEAIDCIIDDKNNQLEKLDKVELAEVKARIEIEAIDGYYSALLKKRVLQVEEQEKEIERLGKFIETLQVVHFKEYQGEKAENKRLRKALQSITEIEMDRLATDVWSEASQMKGIARKALAGESK